MNWFGRLRVFFGRKDSETRVLMAQVATGKYVPTPRDYRNFAQEGYQKNVVAYRSVAIVARGVAGIPWVLYKKGTGKGSKRRQEVEDHPILTLLARPNPMMSQTDFMETWMSFKLISGNGYVHSVGPGNGKITELWTMRPDRVTIVPGVRGYPAAYVYTIGNKDTRFLVDQVKLRSPVLHWKYFHPTDDWYGLAPFEAASMGIDQHNAAVRWNSGLLQNSARPSGALVATVSENSTGKLGQEAFERLKQQIEDKYTGPTNAGKPMILEGGLDWKPFSFSPQQMEWIENKATSARDICFAMGVPPMILGIPGDNTYSNYKEARAALYEETIIPEHDSAKDQLNTWLLPAMNGDGYELDSNKDAIHALAPRRQEVWDKIEQASWLTVNEKREATGYEEVDGGDVILVNSTQVPLEDAVEGPTGTEDPAEGQDPTEDDLEPDETDPAGTAGSKIFNLTNQKTKAREWKAQMRIRKGLERKLMRQSQAVFIVEGHRVSKAIEGLDGTHAAIAAEHEITSSRSVWKSVLSRNLNAIAKEMGKRVFGAAKCLPGARQQKDSESAFDAAMKEWIEQHVGERITGIMGTSRDRILKAIRDAQAEGYDEGTGTQDLADKIQEAVAEEYSSFSQSRSITIARTEIGTASNYALVEAAKSTGIPNMQKEWVAAKDDRTREDHAAVDGMIVAIDEDFDVGGYKMSQPMDPDAPPSETINCRCVPIFSRGPDTEETPAAAEVSA